MFSNKVRAVFEREGFEVNSSINRSQFNGLLNALMKGGEPYDEDVAKELWDQASGGRTIIQVNDVCQTITDGINILQSKIAEIQDQIRIVDREKTQALKSTAPNRDQLAKLQVDLRNLHQDKEQFQEDLRLVTIPFNIDVDGANPRQSSFRYDSAHPPLDDQVVLSESGVQGGENEDLKWVLWITLIFGLIEIIIIYGKDDFLNLMVVTSLLSIYLLNHFDSTYVKLTLWLLVTSEVLDFIWLFMYASQKWNPPSVGNDPTYETAYLRFIVFFTVCIIVLKVPLGYFLIKYRNVNPDKKYEINAGFFKILLSANKANPVSKGIQNSVN